jgi:hypothetical protein
MNTKTWEILAAALTFVVGNVAYFEMALRSPTSLLPTQALTSKPDVNSPNTKKYYNKKRVMKVLLPSIIWEKK